MKKRTVQSVVVGIAAAILAGLSLADSQGEEESLSVKDIVELTQYQATAGAERRDLYGMSITAVVPRGVMEDITQRYLRSVHREDGGLHHQVVMEVAYMGGWRYYRGAQLLGVDPLPFDALERRMARCTSAFLKCDHRERVMAEVTRQQLDQALEVGLYVNFESKAPGRDFMAYFPPAYVKAYLIKLDGKGAVTPNAFALAAQ